MRWKKDPLKDSIGRVRIINKFLIFPRCINGEWRWLERCNIEQQVIKSEILYDGILVLGHKYTWINRNWFPATDPIPGGGDMKVKIGDKIYDSSDEPIMLIIGDTEKNLIANMADDATKYCSFPDKGYTEEQIKEFMKTKKG